MKKDWAEETINRLVAAVDESHKTTIETHIAVHEMQVSLTDLKELSCISRNELKTLSKDTEVLKTKMKLWGVIFGAAGVAVIGAVVKLWILGA